MAIHDLAAILPPPEKPVETRSAKEWPKIETALGLPLPDDFKSYIGRFGTGCIGRFIWPLNPFAGNRNINLLEQHRAILSSLISLRDKSKMEIPYPIYPDRDGLFPWAITDNGDCLYWLTKGNPNQWRVVLNESRGPSFEEYEMTMTEFLARLITGDIKSDIIPSNFIDSSVLFVVGG